MIGDLKRRLAAEFLGTAFLLATVIGSGIMAQRLSGGNAALALLCNTLPTGAILTVLILIFGRISGAHFNPAVSLAFALRGTLAGKEAPAVLHMLRVQSLTLLASISPGHTGSRHQPHSPIRP